MTTQNEGSILVVEDEAIARKNLVHILNKQGYTVTPAESGSKALSLLAAETFDLVLTDLKMEKVDGMEVLAESRRRHPLTEVIILTGYATVDSAVNALKAGAYHYVAKPYKIEAIRKIVSEALIKRRLQLENLQLKESLKTGRAKPMVVGQSPPMQTVLKTVQRIAPSGANVLLLGESGTGKEIIAQTIHDLSDRASKRFVAFNCGSFSEALMANELFGHEKGAFTGANQSKAGLLETASGGTVFLDEIGDMPPTMQIQLLRVIQEREMLRVGGTAPVPVDVRFIAATHRDLQQDVEGGHFRQDLFFRLNVIAIRLPPLAEREGDVPLLANFFLARKRVAMQKEIKSIEPDAMELLSRYSWPGNVRELENTIERAVAMAEGDVVRVADLPPHINQLTIETYRHASGEIPTLEEMEKRYILWVLEKHKGNKTKASAAMGIDRVSLWRKIKRYGIED
ncbi:MAG: sigma-54 dependent transcriptional regulator [Deltaproteobacteria bacterium]|nr:sigma-54 dependent transcriptional regulator [Deltaproteobacteria bacterium]